MLTRFPRLTLLSAGLMLISSVAAHAAGPLDLIPAEASVVVRVKSPQATIARVAGFVNAVQPGMGFVVQGQAGALGIGISNPTMGGVDVRSDWYVAAFTSANAEPAVVFLVPATKGTEERSGVDQMKEAVGDAFTFAVKDNWVAYSMDEAAIELVEDCIDGNGDALELDRRSTEVFDASDISVFADLSGIAETYGDQLDAADAQIDGLIEVLASSVPVDQTRGVNMEAIWDMYKNMGHGAIQVARDADALTVGVAIDGDAIAIEELLLVKEGSGSAKYLATHPTSELSVLNRLPAGKVGYVAVHGNFKALMKWGIEFASKMLPDDENGNNVRETMKAASESLMEVDFGSAGWAIGLADGNERILEGYAITEATPASKMREVTRQMGQGYSFNSPGIKQEFKVEEDAEKYGDLSADVLRVTQEFDEAVDPLGMQKKIQNVLYGGNTIEQRIVIKGDNEVLQTFGGGSELMKELVEVTGAEASSETTAVQKSRARLLERANLVGLVDVPNLALKIGRLVLQVPDVAASAPVKAEDLEGLKAAPSYAGFSVGTEAQALRMKTALPAKMFQNFAQAAAVIQQKMRQRQIDANNNDGDN